MSNFELARLLVSILRSLKDESLSIGACDLINYKITHIDYLELAQQWTDEIEEVWTQSRELASDDFCSWVKNHAHFPNIFER